MSMSSTPGVVTLPPGVSISVGRETSQSGPTGAVIQGMLFTLTLVNGATTSVFVPYALMNQTQVVEQMFSQRVAAIEGIAPSGT